MDWMIIIFGVCLTFIVYNMFYKWIDKGWVSDTEPFNCDFCLSFWVGFGLFLLSLDVVTFYATFENWRIDMPVWSLDYNAYTVCIPLAYYLVNRLINRI